MAECPAVASVLNENGSTPKVYLPSAMARPVARCSQTSELVAGTELTTNARATVRPISSQSALRIQGGASSSGGASGMDCAASVAAGPLPVGIVIAPSGGAGWIAVFGAGAVVS